MVCEGKPKVFLLGPSHRGQPLQHHPDSYVTPASVHDSIPYFDRLNRQTNCFGFHVKHVGLDAVYFTSHICKGQVCRSCPFLKECTQAGITRKQSHAMYGRSTWRRWMRTDLRNSGNESMCAEKKPWSAALLTPRSCTTSLRTVFTVWGKIQVQSLPSAACPNMKKIGLPAGPFEPVIQIFAANMPEFPFSASSLRPIGADRTNISTSSKLKRNSSINKPHFKKSGVCQRSGGRTSGRLFCFVILSGGLFKECECEFLLGHIP